MSTLVDTLNWRGNTAIAGLWLALPLPLHPTGVVAGHSARDTLRPLSFTWRPQDAIFAQSIVLRGVPANLEPVERNRLPPPTAADATQALFDQFAGLAPVAATSNFASGVAYSLPTTYPRMFHGLDENGLVQDVSTFDRASQDSTFEPHSVPVLTEICTSTAAQQLLTTWADVLRVTDLGRAAKYTEEGRSVNADEALELRERLENMCDAYGE